MLLYIFLLSHLSCWSAFKARGKLLTKWSRINVVGRFQSSNVHLSNEIVDSKQEFNYLLSKALVEDRTYNCLEFYVVLDAVQNLAQTVKGKEMSGIFSSIDPITVTSNYAKLSQLSEHVDRWPLHTTLDVWDVLQAIEFNQSPPDKNELAQFSIDIDQIVDLCNYLEENNKELNLFQQDLQRMKLPSELVTVFHDAFDSDLNLNEDKYPTIKRLRLQIATLRTRIVQLIQSIMQQQDIKDKMADM